MQQSHWYEGLLRILNDGELEGIANPSTTIGLYNHNIHRDFTDNELVGLHYIGGHDVEVNLLNVSAMRQDFAPSFGSYIIDVTSNNVQRLTNALMGSSGKANLKQDSEWQLVEKHVKKSVNGALTITKVLIRKMYSGDGPVVAFAISML